MFRFLRRDPIKKLEAEYEKLVVEARNLQRNGDILEFAQMTARAAEVEKKIDALKTSAAAKS